jgi:hypothetical protein
VATPPEWTTVPAPDDSGWQVYRPTPTHPAAPPPLPAQTTVQPQPAEPTHTIPARRTVPAHPKHARPTSTPIVVKPQPTGAVLAVTSSKGAPEYVSAIILAALLTAMACLAFASLPTGHIRWRRGAAFVSDYRTPLTSVGTAFLLAAAIVFALSRG